jgi:predicted permease
MALLTIQLGQILRRLARAPIFTAITLLTLAVSSGATTAMFSVVECVLLKPLPYPQQEELVAVRLRSDFVGTKDAFISPADYFIFREQNQTVQDIGISIAGIKDTGFSVNVTGFGEPEHVPALGVSDGLLSTLGVTPFLGRSFTQADNSSDSAGTAILSYGYWSRKFGGDPSVIGRTIEVDGKLSVIIGVLPKDFRFLDIPAMTTNPSVVVPLSLDRQKTFLGFNVFLGIARLKPGVTLAQANADLERILPAVNRSFPPPPGFGLKMFEDLRFGPSLRPLKQDVVGDVGKVLWSLMAGISLVLIIACANLANLHLIRAEGRRQELAIRAALGASRFRIAAELLFESLIIALSGGLLGLGVAYGALRILVAMAPQGLPRLQEIGVDGNVVLFALVVAMAAGLLFGSFAVFKYTGASLGIGLRAG